MARRKKLINVNMHKLGAQIVHSMPTTADAKKALRAVGSAARTEWVRLAQQELKTTARDYIRGIQELEVSENKVSITLTGVLPNMVEQGWAATDLRKTLLGPDSNAKIAKDGSRYNTVPFRHASPGSSGRNTGRPMPRAIHNVAKALKPTMSRPDGGKTNYGDRLHPGLSMSKAARKILNTKEREHHKTSIYTGMIREQKTYEKSKGSKYTTFRRISSKAGTGWQHPGITARHLARKVDQYVKKVQDGILREALGK